MLLHDTYDAQNAFIFAKGGNLLFSLFSLPHATILSYKDDGDGGLIFLDRLKVKCGDDSLITKFRLKRNGDNNKVL